MNEYLDNGWDIYHSPDSEFKRQGITFSNVKHFLNLKLISIEFPI